MSQVLASLESRVSRAHRGEVMCPQCCELERRSHIVWLEHRKILENFTLSHATRKVLEDVVDGDARPRDAGFAAANIGLYRDALV